MRFQKAQITIRFMNDLITFQFDKGQEVRTVDIDGVPWFVAKDVCDILGLEQVTKALQNFPENERNTLTTSKGIHEGPGNPNVNIINEPGLYRLIFQSRKPEAEAFKTWVFTEVLPAIRKEGYYQFRKGHEKELALKILPPLESPQAGEYRYKFFELRNAPEMLELLSEMAARDIVSRNELMAILMCSSPKEAFKKTIDRLVKDFIQENIILTGDANDHMVIENAYQCFSSYLAQFSYIVSRQKFTRAIRKIFNYSILEWVKRIDGKPTRVFVSCKLKEAVNE